MTLKSQLSFIIPFPLKGILSVCPSINICKSFCSAIIAPNLFRAETPFELSSYLPDANKRFSSTEIYTFPFFWIEGYWKWSLFYGKYIWVEGRWERERPGYFWVPGYWEITPGGFYWVEGYWGY